MSVIKKSIFLFVTSWALGTIWYCLETIILWEKKPLSGNIEGTEKKTDPYIPWPETLTAVHIIEVPSPAQALRDTWIDLNPHGLTLDASLDDALDEEGYDFDNQPTVLIWYNRFRSRDSSLDTTETGNAVILLKIIDKSLLKALEDAITLEDITAVRTKMLSECVPQNPRQINRTYVRVNRFLAETTRDSLNLLTFHRHTNLHYRRPALPKPPGLREQIQLQKTERGRLPPNGCL